MVGCRLEIGCSPKDYLERMRSSYFHEIKTAASHLVTNGLRNDSSVGSKSVIYWIASRTIEQYLMLFSMAGRMPDLDTESLLISLLMPMQRVSKMQGSKDIKSFCAGVDEIYLAYSALRKKLNE